MQFNEEKNLADIEFLLPTSKVKVNLSCIRLHVEKCVIAYLRKLLECGIASQESVKVLNPNVTEKMISCTCILSGNILRSKCYT